MANGTKYIAIAGMATQRQEIADLEVHGESGAGLVKVLMNGRHEVKRVHIDPGLGGEVEVALLIDRELDVARFNRGLAFLEIDQ